MKRMLAGAPALLGLLLCGTAAPADELIVPFHATLTLVEDCGSSTNPSPQCLGFQNWLSTCQTQGYDGAFQVVRKGEATLMGPVTSFEQGCLDAHTGPGGIWRAYVQLTITARNGDTLSSYAAGLFDFATANFPGAGSFSIQGGTGHFAGARGSGTAGNVTIDGVPGAIATQDGWLRLPKGHR
jgi:hypothetical protein